METKTANDQRARLEAKADTERNPPEGKPEGKTLARRALVVTCVVFAIALVLLLAWYAADLLLLVFAGVLISILLRRFSRVVRDKTGLGRGLSLTLVALTLVAVIGLVAWFIADRVGSQADELTQKLPVALDQLRARFADYSWAQAAVQNLPSFGEMLQGRSGVLARITGLASTTLGAIVNMVVVVTIGLYLASQPELYSGGIKRLLPFRHRERAGEVMGVLDEALGRWLLGRFVLMILNGGLTALALWLLGVPLALTLGLITGLLNFIPNFGPIVAAIPAVLIALLQSPQLALYTVLVYIVVQMIDGYVLTPLVDRRSVELPPVVTISSQVLLGLLFGFVGLLIASPLTATVMLLVKMLYIEDVLGDPVMRESVVGERDTKAQQMEPGGESKQKAAAGVDTEGVVSGR